MTTTLNDINIDIFSLVFRHIHFRKDLLFINKYWYAAYKNAIKLYHIIITTECLDFPTQDIHSLKLCRIDHIPLSMLQNLKYLDINDSGKLKELNSLPNLKFLNLVKCQPLTRIYNLTKLHTLNIDNCLIKEIDIPNLVNLKVTNCNQFNNLTTSVMLSNLVNLFLTLYTDIAIYGFPKLTALTLIEKKQAVKLTLFELPKLTKLTMIGDRYLLREKIIESIIYENITILELCIQNICDLPNYVNLQQLTLTSCNVNDANNIKHDVVITNKHLVSIVIEDIRRNVVISDLLELRDLYIKSCAKPIVITNCHNITKLTVLDCDNVAIVRN